MIRVVVIVMAFLLGTLMPAPQENAAADSTLPDECNGAQKVATVTGEGESQVAFYQDLLSDDVYVSWELFSSGVLKETSPNKHVIHIDVYDWKSDDGTAYSGLYQVQDDEDGGGQSGYCEWMGQHHDFEFDIFAGAVGRTLEVSCSATFEFGGGVEIGISVKMASGSAGMDWGVTVSCEVEGKLESAVLIDLTDGYYHCPVGSTCMVEIIT